MSSATKGQPARSALDVLEQATHLLRTAPLSVLALYYVGTLPFVLGALYFWTDMSRSPYAYQHLTGATLGMAALFLWMKFWQVLFARQVRMLISGEAAPTLTVRRCGRILVDQAALQSSGLVVLPLASIPVLPFGWAYAFYQNLTALDDGETGELLPLFHKARRQATLWPGQNHALLSVLLGFGLGVFLNWGCLCYLLPGLLKMCLGVESAFTRSNLGMLNMTFLATIIALSYLSVDPLVKVAYALRCFYGESVHSGEDLKAELRSFATARVVVVCVLTLFALFGPCQGANTPLAAGKTGESMRLELSGGQFNRRDAMSAEKIRDCQLAIGNWQFAMQASASIASLRLNGASSSHWLAMASPADASPNAGPSPEQGAGEPVPAAAPAGISPPTLDRTIREVIRESKYTWRTPREKLVEPAFTDGGIIGRFLNRIWELTKGTLKKVFKALGAFLEWVAKWLGKIFGRFFRPPASSTPGYGWIMSLNLMLYLLVAAVVLGLLYLGYRIWRNRHPREPVIASEAILPLPDVADENVGADQLPEDGWVKLARELLARGELRLALRAFYLASLAQLAERNLLSVAKFKSNRDYERELLRRGHSFPELLAAFGENVAVFERIWYGLHEVSLELVNEFAAKVERMRGGSEGQRP